MPVQQELHPLCDEHHSAMVKAWKSESVPGRASEGQTEVWVCTEPGCVRVYDFELGYYPVKPVSASL